MHDKDRLLNKIAFHTDLAAEPIPGMPLVEILGCQRVLIENHKGVTMYGCNEIRVKVSYGQLSICGSGLELARITKQLLIVTGQIDGLSLLRRAKS